MKRKWLFLPALVVIVATLFLGYDLLKGVLSPCETIFEQTTLRLNTKLKVFGSEGEVGIGREQFQKIHEASQSTALNLKTCCIVLQGGKLDSDRFLQCKGTAEVYEKKIEQLLTFAKAAKVAKQAGDTTTYNQQVRLIDQSIRAAEEISVSMKQQIKEISSPQPAKSPETVSRPSSSRSQTAQTDSLDTSQAKAMLSDPKSLGGCPRIMTADCWNRGKTGHVAPDRLQTTPRQHETAFQRGWTFKKRHFIPRTAPPCRLRPPSAPTRSAKS